MYSWFVLLPFLGAIVLNLPVRALMQKVAFGFCLFIAVLQMCLVVFPKYLLAGNGLDVLGTFLKFNFSVDFLSRVLLFCIGLVLFCTLLVQRYRTKNEKQIFDFANLSLLILAGMNGVVLVRDIFSLYVFLEITAVGSFILIAFDDNLAAFEGAFKYIVLSVVATVLMLSAIALLLMVAGDTTFASLGAAIKNSPDKFLISLSLAIFICGCFIKGGLVPFHGWIADAYSSAPASVSVLLAGIVTKTVGIYTLIRIIIAVFGFSASVSSILLAVGMFSVVLGALAALGQNDFKRMLAYSSISQVGYIILGLGSGTLLGLAGAVFHLFNHCIFKSLLFINSAAVESETGTRDIDKLSGLAKQMPLTGITSVLASLSAAGIPPLAGFWSKLMIILALWMAGFYSYAAVALLASVLTLAYFLSLQRSVFFGLSSETFKNVKEAGFAIVFPSLLLAGIILGVGLFFPFFINAFVISVSHILGG